MKLFEAIQNSDNKNIDAVIEVLKDNGRFFDELKIDPELLAQIRKKGGSYFLYNPEKKTIKFDVLFRTQNEASKFSSEVASFVLNNFKKQKIFFDELLKKNNLLNLNFGEVDMNIRYDYAGHKKYKNNFNSFHPHINVNLKSDIAFYYDIFNSHFVWFRPHEKNNWRIWEFDGIDLGEYSIYIPKGDYFNS